MLNQKSSANKRNPTLLIYIISFIFIFSGCTQNNNTTVTARDTVTFTDSLGRNINVPKKPQRVAALIGSFADIWQLAGGTICATAEDAWEDFGFDSDDAINIGGAHSPSLELLISANPDFVIASSSTASNVEMKDSIEAMGIPIAYFDVDSFDDYLAMLDICTDITDRKDLYQTNGLNIRAQIRIQKDKFSNSGIPENQRKILILRAASGSVKAKGSDGTVLGEILKDLGCINIADSDTHLLETLSTESIIRQNPYHIFVVTMGNDTESAIRNLNKLFRENPAWSSLDAIRENRLYIMDKKLFNIKPNAKWAQSYEQLNDIFLHEAE